MGDSVQVVQVRDARRRQEWARSVLAAAGRWDRDEVRALIHVTTPKERVFLRAVVGMVTQELDRKVRNG